MIRIYEQPFYLSQKAFVASTQHPRIGHGHASHGYVIAYACLFLATLYVADTLQPPGEQVT